LQAADCSANAALALRLERKRPRLLLIQDSNRDGCAPVPHERRRATLSMKLSMFGLRFRNSSAILSFPPGGLCP